MQVRAYYTLRFRLDGGERYLIWYRGRVDGVQVNAARQVLAWPDLAALQRDAARLGIRFEPEEPADYDLERLSAWLAQPAPEAVDCSLFTSCWDLFTDVMVSVWGAEIHLFDADEGSLREKLFYGCNLFSPPGRCYVPAWSPEEIAELHAIFDHGLAFFRQSLQPALTE